MFGLATKEYYLTPPASLNKTVSVGTASVKPGASNVSSFLDAGNVAKLKAQGWTVVPKNLDLVQMTQAQYDALATKDPNTLYVVK